MDLTGQFGRRASDGGTNMFDFRREMNQTMVSQPTNLPNQTIPEFAQLKPTNSNHLTATSVTRTRRSGLVTVMERPPGEKFTFLLIRKG